MDNQRWSKVSLPILIFCGSPKLIANVDALQFESPNGDFYRTISYEIQARSFKVANLLVPDTLELISGLKLKNSRNLSLKLVLRSNDLESIF